MSRSIVAPRRRIQRMAVAVATVAAASVFATTGFADAAEADNVDRVDVSASTQVVTPEVFLPADEPTPDFRNEGLEDRFLALPVNPSTEQVLAAMYPDDPAAQQQALAAFSQLESETGVPAGSGFSWKGAWKVTKCVSAVGAFVGGNLVLISKLRRMGGVWTVARRVVRAGSYDERVKALVAVFGEISGLGTVASSCG